MASELDIGVVDHLPVLQLNAGRKGSGSRPSSSALELIHFSAQGSPLTPVPIAAYGRRRVCAVLAARTGLTADYNKKTFEIDIDLIIML